MTVESSKTEKKYPQNSLRNLARDNLETELFYLVDIDTVPVANLRTDFTKFAKNRGLFKDETMQAFITPAYEIKETLSHSTPYSLRMWSSKF